MLTIPATVVSLLKADSCRKNFRVTFPNGELSDLTNADVIRESVRFTESVCSRESFRFGTAEYSVLEFETVNVANMRGMTIRAYCEVDVSSLSAAEISAIQAGTWDGTLVPAASSDLGWAYFRIPYGTFVVSECPRDAETMTRRKVKAYTPAVFTDLNVVEATKLRAPIVTGSEVYQPFVVPLVLSQLAQNDDAVLISEGLTKTSDLGNITGGGVTYSIDHIHVAVTTSGGDSLDLHISSMSFEGITGPDGLGGDAGGQFRRIWGISWDKAAYRRYAAALDAFLESLDVDLDAGAVINSAVSVPLASVEELRNLVVQQYQVYNGVRYGFANDYPWKYNALLPNAARQTYDTAGPVAATVLDIYQGNTGWTPWYPAMHRSESPGEFGATSLSFPLSYVLTVDNLTAGTSSTHSDSISAHKEGSTYYQKYPVFGCWRYEGSSNNPLWDYNLQANPNGDTLLQSSFVGSVNIGKIVQDYVELLGKFAAPTRDGSVEVFALDDSSPIAFGPGDYRAFSWDEYSGVLIGTIRFKCSDGGDAAVFDYRFGNGQGVYDMSDNDLLYQVGMGRTDAVAFLQANVVPKIATMAFQALDMDARGLPYVESSDFLQITARDGVTAFKACLTRQELAGIQFLQDHMEAVGVNGGGGDTGSAAGSLTAQGSGEGAVTCDVGTSGGWTFRKWSNGIAEAWCENSQSHAITSSMGSLYHSVNKSAAFPSGLFTAAPVVTAATKGGGYIVGPQISAISKAAITFGVISGTAHTVTVPVEFYAVGKWK